MGVGSELLADPNRHLLKYHRPVCQGFQLHSVSVGHMLGLCVLRRHVDVPLGRWTDSAACVLYDKNYRDTLYRDQADYVSRVKASAEKMVKDRWILPSAAEILVEEARNIPW